MALTASAFAYTWSKWNAECGNDKVVIQAVEQLQNEPLLEVRHVERLHDLVTTKSPHGPRKSSASRTEKTLHLTLGVKSTPHTDRVYGSHMASFLNLLLDFNVTQGKAQTRTKCAWPYFTASSPVDITNFLCAIGLPSIRRKKTTDRETCSRSNVPTWTTSSQSKFLLLPNLFAQRDKLIGPHNNPCICHTGFLIILFCVPGGLVFIHDRNTQLM